MDKQSVVIDNGTSFTKIGYGGNIEPDLILPTVIADFDRKDTSISPKKKDEYIEYNYYIGEYAISKTKESKNHKLIYPIQNGLIENWDLMEKFWTSSIFEYLKCDPEEHNFVLTENLMNTPLNREKMAEIFFETFGVPGLYIGVQPVMAFLGYQKYSEDCDFDFYSYEAKKEAKKEALRSLTGIVIDSGESDFHVVPFIDGFVVDGYIKHIPISGKKITELMQEMIKERGEKICTADLKYAVMEIKEKYGYLARDLVEELAKYDKKQNVGGKLTQNSKFRKFEGIGKISNKPYSINLGYELFFVPEAIISPGIVDINYKFELDEIIDYTIQRCPKEYRRKLYSNIIFSGKSTSFKNLDRKLELYIDERINERLKNNYSIKNNIYVSVTNNCSNNNIVWLGASYISSNDSFKEVLHTREEYEEKGPSCCRFSHIRFIDLK